MIIVLKDIEAHELEKDVMKNKMKTTKKPRQNENLR